MISKLRLVKINKKPGKLCGGESDYIVHQEFKP
jgi:hypothetical protein